jgi:Fe-S-cluster containining protein
MSTAELIAAQRAREPKAKVTAEAKVRAMRSHPRPIHRALRQAEQAPRARKRIRLLLQAADAWASQIAPLAACRRGCAHCCHIPVTITTAEARLLAEISGRPLVSPVNAMPLKTVDRATPLPAAPASHLGPCPFLQEGACTVYEHRPVACRTHFNLDEDDLLCRVVPGHPANVPYANSVEIVAACLLLQRDESLADIREFFP